MKSLLSSILLGACSAFAAQPVLSEFIYEQAPYPSCHASTLAENASHEIVAAWFGGTKERDPDVCIYVSRREAGGWTEPVAVADGLQPDGKRLPTWNPVLFQPAGAPLTLFYKIGPSPSSWWGMVMTSPDGGRTWSKPVRLPEGILGPIKNKPVVLRDGSWLSPSSMEGGESGWRVHFERSRDSGKTWEFIGPVDKGGKFNAIQPSVLFHKDGALQALCRTKEGVVAATWSRDEGRTWSALSSIGLPNPNSGTDAVTLADGRQLLVYNHSAPPPERPTKGLRYPIDVALSDDGLTWTRVLTLDENPCDAGYAYPAVIQSSDGLVHLTYTWDRKRIKHVVLDPRELRAAAAPQPVQLLCEYAAAPLGVDIAAPRLSWRMAGGGSSAAQSAYRILVASSESLLTPDQADLWDSGRIESEATTQIAYAGKPLRSSQRVYWKVRLWDRLGLASDWSPVSTWTMGLLAKDDWRGIWIVAPAATETLLLRKVFEVRPGLRRAIAHVCGLGQYEMRLNGEKVGKDLFTPGWTDYDRTTIYDTQDLTSLLRPGTNAIGLTLGNGMYHVERRNRFAKFTKSFGPLRAIVHLMLEYADGSTQFVGSDESWSVRAGALTYSSIYGGEDLDARLVPLGWDRPGFDDASWQKAVRLVRPADTLHGFSRTNEPVREIEVHKPVSTRLLADGAVLYDLGQNASHMPRLRIAGPAGSTVRLVPAEVADEKGIIRSTMGSVERGLSWWQYTKSGDSEEIWFPQFYYVGCRYLQATLSPALAGGAAPVIVSLDGVVVHSIATPTGTFACSNPLLNRIRDLIRWAQRSNMVSVLTDCPHREKLGWIEQFHLNGPSIRYEFDMARSFTKAMADMADAQTAEGLIPNIAPEYADFKGAFRGAAEWGAAFIAVPWQQYQFNGDTRLMRTHFPAMKRYLAYLGTRTVDGILSDGLGDWYDLGPKKLGAAQNTPPPFTSTAFYFQDAKLLSQIAAVLGHEDEAKKFAALAEQIRLRFNRAFYDPATRRYGTGSQAACAIPLAMGIVEPADRSAVLATLVQDLETRGYANTAGDIGFRYVLLALGEAGRHDVIYRLLTQEEHPGYAFMLKKGATALTESWDAKLTASHNHFMLGQATEWFYKELLGIESDPAGPGFKRILIHPSPVAGLTWAEGSYTSPHGAISVHWETKDGRFLLKTTVPANTTATLVIPTHGDAPVLEAGAPAVNRPGLRFLRREGDRAYFYADSGSYRFDSAW